jgi:GrpB-like predicted nucleotidyltransferase (UPF0157 family)
MAQKVRIVDYNPLWPEMFKEEANKIKSILKFDCIRMYHIGSTSIEGLRAKPVIDILIVCSDINKIDSYNDLLKKEGYEAMGENGVKGRRYFRKGNEDGSATFHLHSFDLNSRFDIDRHIVFRDYLRTHKEEALNYQRLKEELANKYPNDMESYFKGKQKYLKEVEDKALEWRKASYNI